MRQAIAQALLGPRYTLSARDKLGRFHHVEDRSTEGRAWLFLLAIVLIVAAGLAFDIH